VSEEKTEIYRAKLSKQQKLVLRILREYNGRISRQGLIERVAEGLGRIKRDAKYVTNSCRVSISRSIRRLQKRGLVWADLWSVYLPEKYPRRKGPAHTAS
jgi:DNA-binding MarR family transcriptional regulator